MAKVLLLVLLYSTMAAAQALPDAPQRVEPAKSAGFWTFRQSWQDPPLRTNRQVLTSKTFLALHAALAIAIVVDIRHTHGARENWGSEAPVIPALAGMDYLMDRFFTRSFSVEAPIYGIVHYARDALR